MGDSWEDHDTGESFVPPGQRQQHQQQGPLNPNARTFNFNPTASSYVPPTFGNAQGAPQQQQAPQHAYMQQVL